MQLVAVSTDIKRRKALLRDAVNPEYANRFQSVNAQRSLSRSIPAERNDCVQNQNPYKKSIESFSNRNQSTTMMTTTTTTRQNQQNTMERQHPHRAGKIRLDKQFQVHLQVSAVDEDASSSSVDSPVNRRNHLKESTSTATRKPAPWQSRSGQSSKEYKSNSTNHRQISIMSILDSSDDDDRELLGYIPFAKASRK